jgi:hypothetical protein
MRYYLVLATLCGTALGIRAQSTATVYQPDLNGRLTPILSTASGDNGRTELSDSLNGRRVPRESTEIRTIKQEAGLKITETIVRRYDNNGNVTATERTVAETQTRADGGSTVKATIYRGDMNGQFTEAERRTIETSVVKNGQNMTATSDVSVQRPGPSGMELAEKRHVVTATKETSPTNKTSQEDEIVYRKSANGGFSEALRQTREKQINGDRTTEKSAYFEPDYQGRMALHSQKVAETVAAKDGSGTSQVNIYSQAVPGASRDSSGSLKLTEQQIVQRTASNGTLVETTSVRRPTIQDPNILGPAQKISETACSGKCQPVVP